MTKQKPTSNSACGTNKDKDATFKCVQNTLVVLWPRGKLRGFLGARYLLSLQCFLFNTIYMAIPIKSSPTLTGDTAKTFNEKAMLNMAKEKKANAENGILDFVKEILAKAKI